MLIGLDGVDDKQRSWLSAELFSFDNMETGNVSGKSFAGGEEKQIVWDEV